MQLGKIVMNFCDDNQLREYGPTKVCHEIGARYGSGHFDALLHDSMLFCTGLGVILSKIVFSRQKFDRSLKNTLF